MSKLKNMQFSIRQMTIERGNNLLKYEVTSGLLSKNPRTLHSISPKSAAPFIIENLLWGGEKELRDITIRCVLRIIYESGGKEEIIVSDALKLEVTGKELNYLSHFAFLDNYPLFDDTERKQLEYILSFDEVADNKEESVKKKKKEELKNFLFRYIQNALKGEEKVDVVPTIKTKKEYIAQNDISPKEFRKETTKEGLLREFVQDLQKKMKEGDKSE